MATSDRNRPRFKLDPAQCDAASLWSHSCFRPEHFEKLQHQTWGFKPTTIPSNDRGSEMGLCSKNAIS